MATIEIDFEVFKNLTSLRESESVTYNDVLRKLLGLTINKSMPSNPDGSFSAEAWTTKGITFPVNTEFRATYKGQAIYGRVEKGSLTVNGKQFSSPSAAAIDVTGSPVNGWIFWECKIPGKSSWQFIKSLREKK